MNNNNDEVKKELFSNKTEKFSKISLICGYIALILTICSTLAYLFINPINLKAVISFSVGFLVSIFIIRKSNLILEKSRYEKLLDYIKEESDKN